MTQLNKLHPNIKSFGLKIEAESARSIGLLRDIENTMSHLNRLKEQLRSDSGNVNELIEAVENIEDVIDQDDSVSVQLEQAQNRINDLYNELVIRRLAGRNDNRLIKEDGIEDAYTEAIEAVADLHNQLNALRWAINEHDADISPVSKSFSDPEELIKFLKR